MDNDQEVKDGNKEAEFNRDEFIECRENILFSIHHNRGNSGLQENSARFIYSYMMSYIRLEMLTAAVKESWVVIPNYILTIMHGIHQRHLDEVERRLSDMSISYAEARLCELFAKLVLVKDESILPSVYNEAWRNTNQTADRDFRNGKVKGMLIQHLTTAVPLPFIQATSLVYSDAVGEIAVAMAHNKLVYLDLLLSGWSIKDLLAYHKTGAFKGCP